MTLFSKPKFKYIVWWIWGPQDATFKLGLFTKHHDGCWLFLRVSFPSELGKHSPFGPWPSRWHLQQRRRAAISSPTSLPALPASGIQQWVQFPLTIWKSGKLQGTNVPSSSRRDTCLMNQQLCRWCDGDTKQEEPGAGLSWSAVSARAPSPAPQPAGLDHTAFHTNVGHLTCCQQAAVPSCQDNGKLTVTRRNYFQAAALHLKQRTQIFKAALCTQNHDYLSMCPMVAT